MLRQIECVGSLTRVAADGEAMVRAQAFASAHVQRAVLLIHRS